MAGIVGGGLLPQIDGGGNGHSVPAEDVGQVLTNTADTACTVGGVVSTGSAVTGLMVGVVGVTRVVLGLGGGGRLRGAVGALRVRLGPALKGLGISLVLALGTAVGIGRGAIGGGVSGLLGRALFGGVATSAGGDVGSPLIRFGHGLPGRLGAAGLLGVLR